MEQRRGSIAKQLLLVETAKSVSVSRRGSVVNSTTVARRNSVILSDDSKALRECEDKLKYANDMLVAAEQTNLKLRQEFDLLAGKFNDVKNCAIDIGWRYCPTFSPDFVFIPKLDPDLPESESKAGKYLLRETLGRGQFSVVKACQTQALTLINGQKPPDNNLLVPIVPTSEEKDSEVSNGNSNMDMQKKKATAKSACKIISKDNIYSIFSILRLEQELKALNALQNHKNIVEYRDCLHGNKFLYIITEYVPTDLFEFLETNHDKLNENIAGVIMRELVDGVTFMASKGIVHRDLKPENILISLSRNDIKVKICDFGLCSFLENGHSVLSDFRGSPGFFAPEVLLQKSFCSLKAETFSLGCIGLEMLVPQKFFAEVWMTPYINNMKLLDGNLFNRSIRDAVIESNIFIKSKYNTAVSEFIHQTLNIVPQNRKHAMDLRNFDWITHTNKLLAADILNSREPRSFHLRGNTHHANPSSANGPASNYNSSNVASSSVAVAVAVVAAVADPIPPGIGVLSKPLTEFVDRVPSPGAKAFSSSPGAKETNSSSTAYNYRLVPEITDLSPAHKAPTSTTSLLPTSVYTQPPSSQFLDAYSPTFKGSSSTSNSTSLKPNTPVTSHSAIPDIMTAILNTHNPQSYSSSSSAESTVAAAGSILPAIKLQRRGSVHGNRVGYNNNNNNNNNTDKDRDIAREIGGGGHFYSSKSGPIGLGMGSMGMGGGPVPTLAYGRTSGTQLDINPFSPANEQRDRDWRAYAALKSMPHNSHTTASSVLPPGSSSSSSSSFSQYNNSNHRGSNQFVYNPPGLYNFKEISYDYSIDKFNMQSMINNLDKASGYKTLTVKNLQDNQKLFIQSAEGRGFHPASLSSVHIGQTL